MTNKRSWRRTSHAAGRPSTAECHADLIRIALSEAAPAGMTRTRLMALCELSRWQTRRGLATLRDLYAERSPATGLAKTPTARAGGRG